MNELIIKFSFIFIKNDKKNISEEKTTKEKNKILIGCNETNIFIALKIILKITKIKKIITEKNISIMDYSPPLPIVNIFFNIFTAKIK